MALIIPNAELQEMTEAGDLLVIIPRVFIPMVQEIVKRCRSKHNGFIKVGLDVPFRPRSRRAQGKLHAIIGRLAPLVDMSVEDCKRYVKMEATALGYPIAVKTIWRGTPRERTFAEPKSEADASVGEENLLIECALKIGAEAGHDLEAEWQASMRGM